MTENTNRSAFDVALRLLGNREHSRKEIVIKLEQRRFDSEAIDTALGRLEELELLDDKSFAVNYVVSRSRKKPSGAYKLRYELLQKGVPDAIIDEVLEEYDSAAQCLEAAQRKLRLLKGDLPVKRNKLYAFLVNRGFDSQTIRETLARVLSS